MFKKGQTIQLEFRKWDDSLHYEWPVSVVESHADRVLVEMPKGTVFVHHTRKQTRILKHDGRLAFWRDRWFSGGPDFLPGTKNVIEYYFNIGTPPEFGPDFIRVIDLELDVKARPDLSFEEFDEDDFQRAIEFYRYPPWLIRRVRLAAEEIKDLLRAQAWPILPPQETKDFQWMKRS